MVRKHKGKLALAVLAVVAMGGIVLGYQVWADLPHPRESNQQQLTRWIVLRDLQLQPPEIQIALVDRFLQLESPLADDNELPAGVGERVSHNLRVLKRAWFIDRVAVYHSLSGEEKQAYLQQQLDATKAWSNLTAGEDSSQEDSLFLELDGWLAEAKGDQWNQAVAAVRAGLLYWLATNDLAEYSPPVRKELALRIAADLDDAPQASAGAASALSSEQQQAVSDNAELLLEAWLLHQAAVYESVLEEEKPAFINEQLERFVGWNLPALLPSSAENENWALRFSALCDQWIAKADAEQKTRLSALVAAIKRKLILQQLGWP